MADLVLLVLGGTLAFVFGWNNSSFLVGNARGSGAMTLRESLLVSSAGLVLGVALEGSKMVTSLSGDLAPLASDHAILATLLAALFFTVALTAAKVPVSFSTAMVGGFAGAVFASSMPLNAGQLSLVVAFWFVAPLLTAALTFVLYDAIRRGAARASLLAVDRFNRLGMVGTSAVIAYVLGANNIGLIYGTAANGDPSSYLPAAAVFTLLAIAGMVALGRGTGVSATIGDRMVSLSSQGVVAAFLGSAVVIWIGTQLSVPVSISQCLLGGMIGAAFTKDITVINRRVTARTVSTWVVVPLGAFLLSFVLYLL